MITFCYYRRYPIANKTVPPQHHPNTIIVCDDAATMDLKVRTVSYFKDLRKTMTEVLGHD